MGPLSGERGADIVNQALTTQNPPTNGQRPLVNSLMPLPVSSINGAGHKSAASVAMRNGKTAQLRIGPIGDALLVRRAITQEQLTQALGIQHENGGQLGRILVEMGAVSERELARTIAEQWDLPYVELLNERIDPDAVRLIPAQIMQRHGVMPVERAADRIVVAMPDPANVVAIDDIRLVTGLDVDIIIASPDDIARAQTRFHDVAAGVEALLKTSPAPEAELIEESAAEDITIERLRSMVEEAPIVRVVNQLIDQAIRAGASDIHIEPRPHDVQVRFRIDGLLQDITAAPKQIQAALISRVKILANLDIAERRQPQDGHIHLRLEGKKYDLRVSTLATVLGEKIVIRVLDQSRARVALNEIGLPAELQGTWEGLIGRPYGMVIVTGPTGSGKTTTLYTSVERINTSERNIVSIEDPVEYRMPRVNQVQVNPRAGVTFATGLRSILRQDPDIVLIGEIRDRETAQIAVQASMTGHLVLTTLHTNDAPGAATRLADMGVEPFLVTASLNGVLAQRLVRVICPHCKEAYTPPSDSLRRLGLDPAQHGSLQLYRGRGCDFCRGTGYRGRTGTFELMVMNDRLRALMLTGASADQLRAAAQQDGMRLLRQDGVQKALEGVTTVEELLRVAFMAEGGA